MRSASLLLIAIATLLSPLARADEPVLHVRARTRIDLQSVVRVPGGLMIRGALFDNALEEPIPGRVVAIAVDGPNGFYRYAEPTSDDGSFRWRVPLPLGRYVLRLAAGGDEEYAPAPVLERTIDVERRSPVLTLLTPENISSREEKLDAVVEIREPDEETNGAASELPIVVLVDGRVMARGATRAGRLDFELPVHELGKPGARVTLSARFDGDALRNPAQASRTIRVTTPTTLTLTSTGESASVDEEVAFSGRLSDDAGPIPAAIIELSRRTLSPIGAPHTVATVLTDVDGRYRAQVRASDLGSGRVAIEARFGALGGYREPSRSSALELTIHSASLHANPIYLVPPLLTALALLGLAVARRRPWRELATRLRARVARPAPLSGFSEGRTRLLRTLRPANDFGLTGQVCDSANGQPIEGATLVVNIGGQNRSALTDGNGQFSLEALPAGTLAVAVAAVGYVSERFHRTVPHRGELRGARVLLVPILSRIFAAYDSAAQPLAPAPCLTGLWTPRELLEHVRGRRLVTDDLAQLTAVVEAHCYGPLIPDVEALAEVERLVEVVSAPTTNRNG